MSAGTGSCCSLCAMACNAGKALFSQDIAAKQAAEHRGTELQDLSTQSAPKSAFKKACIPPSTISLPAMRLAGDEVTIQVRPSAFLKPACWLWLLASATASVTMYTTNIVQKVIELEWEAAGQRRRG